MLLSFVVFIFILGFTITIHEAGHFYYAKKAGMRVYEFSIGMGPLLYTKEKNGTYYSIRAIPIGGYVSIAEERQDGFWFSKPKHFFIKKNEKGEIKYCSNKFKEGYEEINLNKFERKDNSIFINGEKADDELCYVDGKLVKRVAKEQEFYERKPILSRAKTIFAGPLVNFILGIILFSLVSVVRGFPVEIDEGVDYGLIGEVSVNSPAENVLESGDRIYEMNNERIFNFEDIVTTLEENATTQNWEILVMRDGETFILEVQTIIDLKGWGAVIESVDDQPYVYGLYQENPFDVAGIAIGSKIIGVNDIEIHSMSDLIMFLDSVEGNDDIIIKTLFEGEENEFNIEPWSKRFLTTQDIDYYRNYLGVSPDYQRNVLKSVFVGGVSEAGTTLGQIAGTFGSLFNGDISARDLSGPVGMFYITQNALEQGTIQLLTWMALLNINIGFLNLIPFPALDGGRLAFLGYEKISKKKANEIVEIRLQLATFVLLFGFMIYVTWADVMRFIVN